MDKKEQLFARVVQFGIGTSQPYHVLADTKDGSQSSLRSPDAKHAAAVKKLLESAMWDPTTGRVWLKE